MARVGPARALLCETADDIVEAVRNEIAGLRPRGPLVILYETANDPAYQGMLRSGLVYGHEYSSWRRNLTDLRRTDADSALRYLFVRPIMGAPRRTGIGERALEDFAVLCFQRDAILQVPRTGAERCLIVLSRSMLTEFRKRS
jgi:hypothetical protein